VGVDLDEYRHAVRRRFANPALGHTTRQVAMDGSQKLGPRLLGTVRDLLAAGRQPEYAALATATWMRYVTTGRSDTGEPITVEDPLAERIAAAVADAATPAAVADALLGVREIFGEDLRTGPFRDLVVEWLARLAADGVTAAAR
ncbi:MAG: mannitol dehydrogenase family protein, partial [Solirubrobacterales bacterium]|nr:mannitol dehydrogenase family protein [Solirubrobacterales bacterium]